jgi:hypothetical protein
MVNDIRARLRRAAIVEPSHLRGGVRSPRRFVGWSPFFRFPGL